jgi:hypothetical protein
MKAIFRAIGIGLLLALLFGLVVVAVLAQYQNAPAPSVEQVLFIQWENNDSTPVHKQYRGSISNVQLVADLQLRGPVLYTQVITVDIADEEVERQDPGTGIFTTLNITWLNVKPGTYQKCYVLKYTFDSDDLKAWDGEKYTPTDERSVTLLDADYVEGEDGYICDGFVEVKPIYTFPILIKSE